MSINWTSLRPWNGSQQHAFEELCCQLAECESAPSASRFFRKGAPDAGVECFWRLPNGDEWGWQAKFFLSSPGQSQWRQIDESVKTALRKHPRLTKYIVCLPIDLPDERRSRHKSALQKWHDLVVEWERLAVTKAMSVKFEYWGQSAIGKRLSDERHRGRHWFWFNEEQFSNSWFVSRVDEAVANACDRYTPELNVDLPIRSYFDALGRTPAFLARFAELYSEAQIKFKRIRLASESEAIQKTLEQIARIARELFARIEPWVTSRKNYVEWVVTRPIPWEEIARQADDLLQAVRACDSQLYDLKEQSKKAERQGSRACSDNDDGQLHRLRGFEHAVERLSGFAQNDGTVLSNRPALLLVGAAGQGKTHLLCEIAKSEARESRPRIILYGEQFRDDEPWTQIIRLLGLNCSRDQFIGALEAAGQANNCRVLIFIDALNEGEGNRLWSKFLAGMIGVLARSEWLGICVSVRNSYEEHIIPDALKKERLVRVEHLGFGELADHAAATFFGHFGIEPSTPFLLPEFNNPLFLKMFCQSLKNAGLTRVPTGLRGITKIFQFFIESIDTKLARPDFLDYDPRKRLVENAVERLANRMAKGKTDRLPLDEAEALVAPLLLRESHAKSLFRHLESESVLTVVPDFRNKGEQLTESVRFTYQRFSDHQITQRLLEEYLDKTNPKASFSRRRTLGKLVKDERACWMNRGILDAMAIQVPELCKQELPDLAPHLASGGPMRKAFVESMIWRAPESFTKATDSYINKHVLAYRDTSDDFWNAMLTLATTPNHPYNAERLDKHLRRFELAQRDAFWSIYLHSQWGQQRAVDRLVEWAWNDDDKSPFDDEVIRLAAITLTWFLTTANRFLRDRATKAMVRLCEKRIRVLSRVIDAFTDVNDPYISERLCAVAYGCAMRTTDNEALAELATAIYKWIFESGQPPPHVLLRDYARGVIECALSRGVDLDIDVAQIRPPYRSEWPSFRVPDEDELKPWGEWKERGEIARANLYRSVMSDDEDFSHYVIGDLDEWSCERINEAHRPTHKEVHEDTFDRKLARRWMMQRIIDMGWTTERFGEFDSTVNRYSAHGREANKPERIGKKYQWIAYHELLARLSDNFKMRHDGSSPRGTVYEGPWDYDVSRDIDPSNLLRATQRDECPPTKSWWFPVRFDEWDEPTDEAQWLNSKDDLRDIENLIELTQPDDGTRWLALHGYYSWDQPTSLGEERYEVKRRHIWTMLKAYVAKKSDITKLLSWGKKQTWMGAWMPESHESYSILLGEFFWSPAFEQQNCYYFGREGWTRGRDSKIPADVLVANDDYGRGQSGFDCSLDDTIFIDMPCKFLVDGLNLAWRGVEGHWFNKHGRLIALDPSVRTRGPRVLLFHRDSLIEFLNFHGLTLFWTLTGGKDVIGGGLARDDYKGRMEINGAFVVKDNALAGGSHAEFIAPGTHR